MTDKSINIAALGSELLVQVYDKDAKGVWLLTEDHRLVEERQAIAVELRKGTKIVITELEDKDDK